MAIILENNTVDKDTMQQIYAARLQASLVKFARSVTLQPVSVRIDLTVYNHCDAPAWSTDTGITLVHTKDIGSIASAKNIIRLKGLLVHEMAHVLYTPRSRTALVQWVNKESYGKAFNILEDNRIENFMVANLSGVAPWLVHTVTHEFLRETNPQVQANLLPMIWGRKYLPSDVRTKAYKSWTASDPAVIAGIIDQYLTLNFHNKDDIEVAKRLIREFHAIISFTPNAPNNPNHQGNTSAAPPSNGSQTVGKRDMDKVIKDVQKTLDQDAAHSGDSDESDDTSTAGTGSPESKLNDLVDAIQQAKDDAQEELLEDVKNTIASVKDVDSESNSSMDTEAHTIAPKNIKPIPKSRLVYMPVSAESIHSSRKFAMQLQEVRAMYDPGWQRKTSQGRLNPREFLMHSNLDESFDLWDHGNEDVTDIECVVLLDNSGSMGNIITPAYEAMWSVKRALDSIDASTTVIQFGTYGDILYSAHDKATTRMATARQWGGGSTQPLNSLIRAQQILTESSRAIKMLIVITDGDWGSTQNCDQVIAGLRSQGVMTGLVFLTDPKWTSFRSDSEGNHYVNAHRCEVATKLDNPKDIIDFARQFAAMSQKRLLNV